jgi:hypothetical protein
VGYAHFLSLKATSPMVIWTCFQLHVFHVVQAFVFVALRSILVGITWPIRRFEIKEWCTDMHGQRAVQVKKIFE